MLLIKKKLEILYAIMNSQKAQKIKYLKSFFFFFNKNMSVTYFKFNGIKL